MKLSTPFGHFLPIRQGVFFSENLLLLLMGVKTVRNFICCGNIALLSQPIYIYMHNLCLAVVPKIENKKIICELG